MHWLSGAQIELAERVLGSYCLGLPGPLLGSEARCYNPRVPRTAAMLETSSGSPHIGLNAQLLARPGTYRSAGISTYIGSLLRYLPEAAPEFRYTAWMSVRPDGKEGVAKVQTRIPVSWAPARIAWEQFCLPVVARRAKLDLLHGMAFSVPLSLSCPSVVTVFDMSFALFPHYHPAGRRLYLSLFARLAVRRAKKVIAISESTKRDVCNLLAAEPSKIEVIPCGVDERFRPLSVQERCAFKEQKGLGRYVYYQGTLEPRKDVTTLIEAFSLVRERGIDECDLIIAGAPGWKYDDVYSAVERLELKDAVRFLGYVSPDESSLWYGAADLFVFPSLYEGFGLPPLEAMRCGVPVIVSATSAMPEVVGDAGMFFAPHDVEALADAMYAVLSDESLARSLGAKGLERARSFTWRRTAERTAALYWRCLN